MAHFSLLTRRIGTTSPQRLVQACFLALLVCCTSHSAVKSAPATEHWAFQPIEKPALPDTSYSERIQSPIDAFVLARLEQNGMEPAPRATGRTLARRAAYDLLGLPPSSAEVDRLRNDPSPEAFAQLTDRYLASPRYGERWGRHWLDVARYADTKGYVFQEERRFPYSYTYRDYVIEAFNRDLPFDRFLVEQIAADQLELEQDKRPLAGLGFLTLGRRFLNNQHDIIDDRIDVVTRGTMALTVACARCHDHKYDAIPTEDYYSLYGIFASSTEPEEKPLLGVPPDPTSRAQYEQEKQEREKELKAFRQQSEAAALQKVREQTGEYLLAAHQSRDLTESKAEELARERKLDPHVTARWRGKLEDWKDQARPVFVPWFTLTELKAAKLANNAKRYLDALEEDTEANQVVVEALQKASPSSVAEVAEVYGRLLSAAAAPKQQEAPNGDSNAPDQKPLRRLFEGEDSPLNLSRREIHRLFDVETSQKLRRLQRKLERLHAVHPGAPARAMALVDKPNPSDAHVLIRGNPGKRGERVPRRFLKLVAGEDRQAFDKGSGRLQLARAIASPQNPLTARVIVNRVWLHHFGEGLVDTPSDFGTRADPPSHPKLLDYLAATFIEDGWSLKSLHRMIMLSSTYQQSSNSPHSYMQTDPDNRLLWKMNRRRLDLEAMRDTFLAVAGQLDLKAGGRPVEITGENYSPRRTVYGFVERQNLPKLFRTFDFASPDTSCPQRFETSVPQQALFVMNSPFAIDQTRRLVNRALEQAKPQTEARVEYLYQLLYQRAPDPEEMNMAVEFIETESNRDKSSEAPTTTWQKYAQVLLMSNELLFVD